MDCIKTLSNIRSFSIDVISYSLKDISLDSLVDNGIEEMQYRVYLADPSLLPIKSLSSSATPSTSCTSSEYSWKGIERYILPFEVSFHLSNKEENHDIPSNSSSPTLHLSVNTSTTDGKPCLSPEEQNHTISHIPTDWNKGKQVNSSDMIGLGEKQVPACEHSVISQQNLSLSITNTTKRPSSITLPASSSVKRQRKIERARKPTNSRVYDWNHFMERNGTLCNTLILISSARRRSTLSL